MENTKHHRLTSFAETASEAPLQEPIVSIILLKKQKIFLQKNVKKPTGH